MNDYTLHYAFQRQDNPDNKWEGSKTDDTYAIIFDLGEFHSFLKKYIFIKLIQLNVCSLIQWKEHWTENEKICAQILVSSFLGKMTME